MSSLQVDGEAYGTGGDGGLHGKLDQVSALQCFRCELLYHGGYSHADLGKVDEKVHVVYVQYLTGLDVLLVEVMVQVVPGHISLFQE